jgi:hypothetical protein
MAQVQFLCGPLRLVNFAALAIVAVALVPRGSSLAGAPWLRSIVVIGQNGLNVFCFGIFLTVLGHAVVVEMNPAFAPQIVVTVGGTLAQVAVAYYLDWLKGRGRAAAQGGSTTVWENRRSGRPTENDSSENAPGRTLGRTPRRMRRIAAWLAVACGVIAAPLAAQPKTALPPETPAACRTPLAVLGDVPTLTRSAAVAARTRRLKVVAIGSSSTAGAGASDRAHASPARLEEELKGRLPNAEISVVNLAEMRQTTQQMIARFPAVLEQRPDIVVWEVGTAEAAPSRRRGFLPHRGAGRGDAHRARHRRRAGRPAIHRDTARLITFEPYLNAISRAAQMREVSLFHRHAVMRHCRQRPVPVRPCVRRISRASRQL